MVAAAAAFVVYSHWRLIILVKVRSGAARVGFGLSAALSSLSHTRAHAASCKRALCFGTSDATDGGGPKTIA